MSKTDKNPIVIKYKSIKLSAAFICILFILLILSLCLMTYWLSFEVFELVKKEGLDGAMFIIRLKIKLMFGGFAMILAWLYFNERITRKRTQ